jgi:bifunctional DNA-binding transcriptional regulator/antitoxin component of YhaV-PrlF toxin-antitoxin module
VTVPKVIAEQYGIHPGDDIQWIPAGEAIRVLPPGKALPAEDRNAKLRLFDKATERHRKRANIAKPKRQENRGWTREELYDRGRSR